MRQKTQKIQEYILIAIYGERRDWPWISLYILRFIWPTNYQASTILMDAMNRTRDFFPQTMTPSQLAEMHSLADFPVPSRIKHLFDKTPAAAESAANAECVTVTTGDGTDTTPAVRRTIHTESFIIFIVIAF
jgi:hypothetical protein